MSERRREPERGREPGSRRAAEREGDAKVDGVADEDGTSLARRFLAEVLGTFALTFVAAGAEIAGRVSGGEVDHVSRAVAPGLLVGAFIYAMGDVSGAHFNPAVTLAFVVRRLFPAKLVPLYWVAQLGGAIAAALLLRIMFGDAATAGVSRPHVTTAIAVAMEVALTWLLVTVILGTADRYRIVGPDAALAVGGTIALCGLFAGPVSGASMNPARSLGPAIVAADIGSAWVYVVGPVIGALLAVVSATLLHGSAPDREKGVEAAAGKGEPEKRRPRPESDEREGPARDGGRRQGRRKAPSRSAT